MKHDLPGQQELPIPEVPNPPVLRGVVGLITPKELAEAIGVAEQTLAGWRCTNKGPDFVKLGKAVFYRLADVQNWVSQNVTQAVINSRSETPGTVADE
jgi:predicted DNA-binding transcriptional regulator AlpA